MNAMSRFINQCKILSNPCISNDFAVKYQNLKVKVLPLKI